MSHEKCGSICFQLILVLPEVSVCFSLWKTEGTQCGFTYANDLYQRFESVCDTQVAPGAALSVHIIQPQRWFLEKPV